MCRSQVSSSSHRGTQVLRGAYHYSFSRPGSLAFAETTLTESPSTTMGNDHFSRQVWRLSKNIREKTIPQGRLVCLDLEYSTRTQKIFEVGVCEYVSGKPIVDLRIRHDCAFDELVNCHSQEGIEQHPINRVSAFLAKRSAFRVYSQTATLSSKTMDDVIRSPNLATAQDVAVLLQQAGVTPETIFIAWGFSCNDLRVLRNFLEHGGYKDILPTDERCFLQLGDYRKRLPKLPSGRQFPLNLDVVFPLIFPGHALEGKNHGALPDALQLRLMTMKLEESHSSQPSSSYQPFKMQSSIDDWFHPAARRGTVQSEWPENTSAQEHTRCYRKRAPCAACSQPPWRNAYDKDVSDRNLSNMGCLECDVSLCHTVECWDSYHA